MPNIMHNRKYEKLQLQQYLGEATEVNARLVDVVGVGNGEERVEDVEVVALGPRRDEEALH